MSGLCEPIGEGWQALPETLARMAFTENGTGRHSIWQVRPAFFHCFLWFPGTFGQWLTLKTAVAWNRCCFFSSLRILSTLRYLCTRCHPPVYTVTHHSIWNNTHFLYLFVFFFDFLDFIVYHEPCLLLGLCHAVLLNWLLYFLKCAPTSTCLRRTDGNMPLAIV